MDWLDDQRQGPACVRGAILAVLAMVLALGASPALALTPPAKKLRAIVHADGPSALASRIVRPGGIATALVDHALHATKVNGFVSSSHSIADVYRYTRGSWHRVAHIDFGKNSLGTNTSFPPEAVSLTGATDFLITFEAAAAAPVSVVSDAGGHWRAVPFVAPGRPPESSIPDGQVKGNQITSTAKNCIPNCAQGKETLTTWAYNAASGTFEPYVPPVGPCAEQTITAANIQAIGCFNGPSKSGVYSTPQAFKLDGLTFAPDPGTTFSFDPGDPAATISASGGGCLQTLVTAVFYNVGEFDLKCWKRSAAISFPNHTLVLQSLFASSPAGNFFGLPFIYAEITLAPGYTATIQGSIGLAPLYGNPLANASFSATTDNTHGLSFNQMCARINPGTFGKSFPLPVGGITIPIRSASLCFYPGLQELAGSATVALPGLGSPQFKATLAVHVGTLPAPGSLTLPGTNVKVSFAGLEVGLQGINKPIFPYIFLQQLAAGVYVYPHLELEGEVGFSFGPSADFFNVGQGLTLLEGVGSASVTFGGDNGFSDFFFANNPDNYSADTSTLGSNTMNFDGKLYLGGTNYSAFATLASAHATIRTHRKSTFDGDIDTGDFPVLPSLTVYLNGEFESNHYTARGSGSWDELGANIAHSEVLASDKGIAGCATVGSLGSAIIGGLNPILGYLASTTPVGFRYVKGQGFSAFVGCDLGNLATVPGVSSASTVHNVSIPRGRKMEEIAVRGSTGPPAALIAGPGNRNVPAPSQMNRLTAEDGALVVADTAEDTTYYMIGKPKPGRWRIFPAEGSSPISSIATSSELGAAGVHVRVSGHDGHRRLSWQFHGAAGRTVLFVDTGKNAHTLIVDTSRAHGSLRFNPLTAGPAGKRKILAIVEQDGLPRSQSVLARYTARPPARLGPIRGLRVRRHGRRVSISWRRVRGAQVYMLTVYFHHHERAESTLPARRSSETIRTTLAGKATVYANASGRRPGASRSARFRAG